MDEMVRWLNGTLELAVERAQSLRHTTADVDVDSETYACPASRSGPVGDLPWGSSECTCGVERQRHAVYARVDAERRLLALHETVQVQRRVHGTHINSIGIEVPNFEPVPNFFHCTLCSDSDDGGEKWPCPSLRLVAYGHRYDTDGWRDEWMPQWVLDREAS